MRYALRGLVLLVACTTSTQAQNPRPPQTAPQELPKSADYLSSSGASLEDLLTRMLANNLDLQAARQRLAQAEARLRQAALRPNPTIDYQLLTDRFTGNNGEREAEFTVNQPFDFGRKRNLRLEAARAEMERIRFEIAALERDKINEMEMVIGQALQETAQLFASERIYELDEAFRSATELRVKVGDASRYEMNQTEAELLRLQAEMMRSASKLAALIRQIKTLAGLPVDAELKLRDEFSDFKEVRFGFAEALQMALEWRPDLQVARQAEREAAAKIRLASSGNIPDFGAIFGYKRSFTVSPAPMPSADWQVKAGVSVTLPLFNRNQGLLQEETAALSEARLHRESLEQVIRRDVGTAIQHLEQAARNLKLHEERILPLAQENVKMARLGFDMGELRLLDYLNEQRKLSEAESSYVQARAERFQAGIEFERAIGRRLH
jgi:cobalt-zinc-cadmium efflux system outer membrane protein